MPGSDLTKAINTVDLPALVADLYPQSGARPGRTGTVSAVWRDEVNPSVSLFRRKGTKVWMFKDQARDVSGNTFHFLTKIVGWDQEHARAEIFKRAEGIEEASDEIGSATTEPESCPADPVPPGEREKHTERYLRLMKEKRVPATLAERGFTFADVKALGIGAEGDDAYLPILGPDGALLNIKRRKANPEHKGDRYRGLPGQGSPAWCSRGFDSHDRVLIVEGELNAMAVSRVMQGFSVMGVAGASMDLHLSALRDKVVYIYADDDEAGEQAQQRWAREAAWAGASEVHLLDRMQEDACDVLKDQGHEGLAEVYTDLVSRAADRGPEDVVTLESDGEDGDDDDPPAQMLAHDLLSHPNTDYGDAQRFLLLYGDKVRHLGGGVWLVWDGRRWRQHGTDDTKVWGMVQSIGRLLRRVAAGLADAEAKKFWSKHASSLESSGKTKSVIETLRRQPEIRLNSEVLDRDPYILNVANGTLDLRSGVLRDHSPDDYLTKITEVSYDPLVEAPRWRAFQQRICTGDEELIAYKQRAFGYSVSGLNKEQCFFIAYGTGANGKSTEQNVLAYILGDYATSAQFSIFASRRDSSGPSPELLRLAGARLVLVNEGNFSERLNEAQIKQVTGGDPLTARLLYSNAVQTIYPRWKIWMATNHRIPITGAEEGIWRRVKFIPYEAFIPQKERDAELAFRMEQEASGILNWLVEGFQSWYTGGLGTAEIVNATTEEYRTENDALGDFLETSVEVRDDVYSSVTDIYRAYRAWALQAGLSPYNKIVFGRLLTDRGFPSRVKKVDGKVLRVRQGMRLSHEGENLMAGLEVDGSMR